MQTGTMSAPVLSTNSIINATRQNRYMASPVTETLTNGFFSVDRNWKVKYWNKAAEQLLGVTAAEIVGKNIWERFAGLLPVEFYNVYQNAFLQNIPVNFEEYWGEMGAWFNVVTYFCNDTLSVSFKSSNKPHAEYPEDPHQRLKVLTELYKFVTEITNDCLWEWDLDNKELFWIDGGHKRVFGYPIENSLIPQSFWEDCLHPDEKERVLLKLNKIIADGHTDTWKDEYRFKKIDGEYASVLDRGHIIFQDGKPSRIIGATQDITEKVLLEKKLSDQRNAQHREVTLAILSAQENERTEIGKELHDNLNQVLAITKMYIEMAKTHEESRGKYLEKSTSLITEVIEEIRKITRRLIIPGLEFTGVFENINNLVDELLLIHPIVIDFRHQYIDEATISEKLQMNIYRIVQEQLTNVLKHSKATRAEIELFKQANQLVLTISDNGIGCDLSKRKSGVGIRNISSRAGLCDGSMEVISKPGKGYLLKVVLPLVQVKTRKKLPMSLKK